MWPWAGVVLLAVAAGHGDVEGLAGAGELDHREALAHGVGLAEGLQPGGDLVVVQAGDQQVDVLAGRQPLVEEVVADRAAHDVDVAVENGDEKVLLGERDLRPLHVGSILKVLSLYVNSVMSDE